MSYNQPTFSSKIKKRRVIPYQRQWYRTIWILGIVIICSPSLHAEDPIVFNDNGAWCWFQDERVIIHDDKLIIGSVANSSGTDGSMRSGNVEVVTYDITAGGPAVRTVLHANLQGDDHNTAAFLPLPNGHYIAMYSKHGGDSLVRYRISTNPNDSTNWQPEQTLDVGAGTTYSNLFRLSMENGGNGRIYNFHRALNWDPTVMVSDDNGNSWSLGGKLLTRNGARPYLKYASNNTDVIHFITTEAHPRDYNNSIYHGYVKNGRVYNSAGVEIDNNVYDGIGHDPTEYTQVFPGDADNVAWTTDIHLDKEDHPYIAFSVQKDQNDQDHRYYYGRWDGASWNVYEMAYAGTRLYDPENDYTGLVALVPDDPNTVYISADVNPITGSPLISAADGERHYEIFKGVTTDGGASWTWEYITRNSTVDNLRPIVPMWDGRIVLLWMRGIYSSFTNYDLDVVGMFDPQGTQLISFVNAGDDIVTALEFTPIASLAGTVSYEDTVSVAWTIVNTEEPTNDNLARMIDRGSAGTDLLRDWMGADNRNTAVQVSVLKISNLPAGDYTWTSYHHDNNDQTGVFDATIYDANGPETIADVDISNGSQTATMITATISANGTDDIILVFDQKTHENSTGIFVMNGFELTGMGAPLQIDFGQSTSPVSTGYDAYVATDKSPDSFTALTYSAFGGIDNITVDVEWDLFALSGASIEDTTTDLSSPTAIFSTTMAGAYTILLTATDSSAQTDSDTVQIMVGTNACEAAQLASAWDGFNYYDRDQDCDVDMVDFTLFAVEWLDDKNLTDQVSN